MMKSLAILGGLALTLSTSLTAIAAPYELGFEDRPSYLPNNVVVLTFDDGPDWVNTAKVLDTLKQKNVKSSFFINSENWSSLSQDQPMRDLVKRMVDEGHELANHTAHHLHLNGISAAQVESEIVDVERNVNNIFGNTSHRLTMLRAPHGVPYQDNDANNPSPAYRLVSPIVARHAVHIGWNIDSNDWVCPVGDSNCVYNNVMNELKTPGQGNYGIILMHSVHSQTADALPRLIDAIRARGFQIWTAEDAVRARYGKSSLQLITGVAPTTPPPTTTPSTGGNVTPIVNGLYSLTIKHSGKCLDIAGTSSADAANVQQWPCLSNKPNQYFTLKDAGNGYRNLVAKHSGKCVEVLNNGRDNKTNVQQNTCNGSEAQKVKVSAAAGGAFYVTFASSGKCMDVYGSNMADGGNVSIWDCVPGAANQVWFFKNVK